jgi:hypothetical protein
MTGSYEVIYTNPARLAEKIVEAGRDKNCKELLSPLHEHAETQRQAGGTRRRIREVGDRRGGHAECFREQGRAA